MGLTSGDRLLVPFFWKLNKKKEEKEEGFLSTKYTGLTVPNANSCYAVLAIHREYGLPE